MPGRRWPSSPGRWRQARSPPGSASRPIARASSLCVVNKLNGCKGWRIPPDPSVASARMTRKVYHEPGQSAHRSGCRQGMSRHLLSGRIKGTHRKHKTQQGKTHQEGKGGVRHCQLRSHRTVRGESCGRMSCRRSSRRQAGRMEDTEVRGIPGDA